MKAPSPAGRPGRGLAESAFLMACALVLALNIPVFASRLGSVLRTYPLCVTEGSEGPSIYPIWKAQNGRPVYEPPYGDPYPITLYNFSFYLSYGSILSLFGVTGEGILLYGRFITLALGALGAVGHWLVVRRVAGPGAGPTFRFAAFTVVAVSWFGTNYMAWWVLAIRPDVGAEALVMWGLLAYLRAAERRSPAGMLAASALFFLGWSFKQSLVWTLFSVSLYTLARPRDWRLLLPLTVPCAAAMAATFARLGRPYWENTIAVQTKSSLLYGQAFEVLGRVALQNAFCWLFWLVPLALRGAARPRDAAPPARGEGALGLALAITSVFGFLALAHVGSNKNHIIESYMIATTLSLVALRRVLDMPPGRSRSAGLAAATALLVPMALFPAAQLAVPHGLGRIALAGPEEYRARDDLAKAVDRLEKPVLIFDEILAQPWHSTGGRYPAFVPDPIWYGWARDRGLLEGGGAASMIRRHAFRSLVLGDWMAPEMEAARASGYVEDGPPPGIKAVGLKLLTLPGPDTP